MVWRKMKKHSAQLSIDGDPNPSGWVLNQRTQTSHQASLGVVQGAAAQCAGLSPTAPEARMPLPTGSAPFHP